jgi:SAM-dependent methyltransferase
MHVRGDRRTAESMEGGGARYWDGVASRIDQRRRFGQLAGDEFPFFRYKREKSVSRFIATLPVAGKEVLEVGCGPGGNLQILAGRGPRLLCGVDIAQGMLNLARASAAPGGASRLLRGSGAALPIADQAFDLVFCVTVAQHNPAETAEALVAEMCRVSRSCLVLIEDVGAPGRAWENHWRRTPAQYAAFASRWGFQLTEATVLRHWVTQRISRRLRRTCGERLPEGAASAQWLNLAESALIRVFAPLDALIPSRSGLCRMVFTKPAVKC